MTNYLKFTSLSLVMLVALLSGCNDENLNDVNDGDNQITEEMDQVISDYIIEENASSYMDTEKQFEVHKIYGTSESDGVLSVYMWSFFAGFNKDSGLEEQAGHSLPAVIELAKNSNQYEVVDYQEPQDGSLYLSSLEKMFPNKYVKLAKRDSGNIEDLQEEMDKKVEQWLEE